MTDDILVLLAHPDLRHSRVNRRLAERLGAETGIRLRDLYALYPDYWIDKAAERQALAGARLIVWLHPLHWYGMPPLMKLWVDEVLAHALERLSGTLVVGRLQEDEHDRDAAEDAIEVDAAAGAGEDLAGPAAGIRGFGAHAATPTPRPRPPPRRHPAPPSR